MFRDFETNSQIESPADSQVLFQVSDQEAFRRDLQSGAIHVIAIYTHYVADAVSLKLRRPSS